MAVKFRARVCVASAFCILNLSTALAADQADLVTINRIVDEGFNRSELPATAAYLTDRIGGRMTNSPQMRAAERWTQQQFRDWGLQNVRTESFEFGRGWSIEKSSARLLQPRVAEYRAIPVAWTPATNGAISAPIIVAPMSRERDFDKWKGKLRGQIVLVTRPDGGSEPVTAPFVRLTSQDIGTLDVHRPPNDSYDHLKTEDLKQAAVILASLLWMSAEREQPLPKMPLPTKPKQTDPFEYETDEP